MENLLQTKNTNALIHYNEIRKAIEILRFTNDQYHQSEVLQKIAALEKLSGVKTSSTTHYSELKKSVEQLQKSNLLLAESKKEIESLYELLKKKADQTSAILKVSHAISNILPIDLILSNTENLVSKAIGSVLCFFYETKQENEFGLEPFQCSPQYHPALYTTEISGQELWQNVIKNKQPVWFPSEEKSIKISKIVINAPFLAVPLISRGNMIGVLLIKKLGEYEHFTPEEMELCAGIAGPVAVAIENWMLYERLERESLRLRKAILSLEVTSGNLAILPGGTEPLLLSIGESLLQISEARYVMMLVRQDRLISIHIPKPFMEHKEMDLYFSSWLDQMDNEVSCSNNICCLNLEDDEKLSFLTYSYGLKKIVSFPMKKGRETVGLIILFFPSGYKNDDVCQSIFQILGNQAAISLDNARLFEDTLRLKHEAESHYQVVCTQKEQLELKNKELRSIYGILSRVREEQVIFQERNRIAEDLHDNVLQILFALGLHFDWCFRQLSPESPVYSKLKSLEVMIDKAIQEIRQVVYEYTSIDACHSLCTSIESLAADLNLASSAHVSVNITGSEALLPRMVRNITYRIVQEALVNSLKHSDASKININLKFNAKTLELSVTDNGIGVPDNIMEILHHEDKKFGLKNMRQRAKFLKGTLDIRRLPTGGTEVYAVIPL